MFELSLTLVTLICVIISPSLTCGFSVAVVFNVGHFLLPSAVVRSQYLYLPGAVTAAFAAYLTWSAVLSQPKFSYVGESLEVLNSLLIKAFIVWKDNFTQHKAAIYRTMNFFPYDIVDAVSALFLVVRDVSIEVQAIQFFNIRRSSNVSLSHQLALNRTGLLAPNVCLPSFVRRPSALDHISDFVGALGIILVVGGSIFSR
ncbi:unnamed protein product [Rodentolepis nana]|uniref:Uncharacterized protein n=1 Tax=Rodentolepis nana TaxID=102285 RepID=A0A3P7SSH3_RODNA|nr:unnamed protein product [Rodentolepis nana]